MVRRFLLGVVAFVVAVVGATTVSVVAVSRMVDGDVAGGVGLAVAALVVVLVLIVALASRVAQRWASPVGDVVSAADRLADGDRAARVQPRGPGPVRRLGGTFNAMAERVEQDERRRRELLADLAHELRTPLMGIRGTVEAMQDGIRPSSPDQLDAVLERTRVMERLLEDLTTLSTAEAGALRLHREPVAPAVLVDDAVTAIAATAALRGVDVDSRVEPGLPDLDVDPVRIGQVLANLLTNALRHGGDGPVTISAARDGSDVRLAVTDTGAGIPPAEQDHVFDRFARAADSGGAGLGLPIVRSLVEAHEGRVELDSSPAGTTVSVVLPAIT